MPNVLSLHPVLRHKVAYDISKSQFTVKVRRHGFIEMVCVSEKLMVCYFSNNSLANHAPVSVIYPQWTWVNVQ